jgi:hypothetical protein
MRYVILNVKVISKKRKILPLRNIGTGIRRIISFSQGRYNASLRQTERAIIRV